MAFFVQITDWDLQKINIQVQVWSIFLTRKRVFGSLALSKYLVGSLMNGLVIHLVQGKQVHYK